MRRARVTPTLRPPMCDGRPTLVTDTAVAGIGRLRSQCSACGQMIEIKSAVALREHPVPCMIRCQ